MPVPGPVEWREVPPELLILHQKTTIPENLTYGQGAKLWVADRETIDILLAQILGIKSLGATDGDGENPQD